MNLKRIYTANLGYSGSSFIAYLMGLHSKIYSVHQPKVNTSPLLWTPHKGDVPKNVGHKLGTLWLENREKFYSLSKDNLNEIEGLSKIYTQREDYIAKLMDNRPEPIYHESANNLFSLMNLYKSNDTKFIHLVRDPVEWITRTLSIQKPKDYINNNINHRNPSFHKGSNDVECVANLWYNINSMIQDIASNNKENWITITLTEIKNTPEIVWPKVFDFLELESPDVDFKTINSKTKQMGSIKPNDTFANRNVHNSKENQVKHDFSKEISKNMDYIENTCFPLWEKINSQ